MQKAKLFSLNWRDALHSVVVAFGSAFIVSLTELLSNGHIPASWVEIKPILVTSASATVAYIGKNFFTNSAGNLGQSEAKAPTTITVSQPESNKDLVTETTTTLTPK